ncbi:DegV family protein [Arthrobacter sp. Br18]|uniref:DegV family protein n=1 Tax=Arthrobacter sp. Br18 TaxID=1312954 RepID=UPI00138ADFD2|nr:DegV family protein [Arthrobacter sp. Br18]
MTDSAAGFPPGWLDADCPARGILIVPIPVLIGGETHTHDDAALFKRLSVALAQGTEIRTSRPSPGQFEQVYRVLESAGFDGIVSVHLSGLLSGTADAARLAAASVNLPVEVIDTGTAGMAQGYAAMAAAASLRAGFSLERSAAAAAIAARGSALYLYVPSLDQLRRGGRVSAAAGWLGSVLSVKVLLKVQEGRLVPLEKVRTPRRAVERLEELVRADLDNRGPAAELTIHHYGNEDQAAGVAARLGAAAPRARIAVARCPAVLAAHVGLGVVGVAISGAIAG